MVTISLEVPTELAERLIPLQDRLPEIIELGLRELELKNESAQSGKESRSTLNQQTLNALRSTGIVTIPEPTHSPQTRSRHTPVQAGGPLASEMIIKERRERR